ncbi:hypothetical protein [Mucilaginibacter sp.]|uniref:hypothetical protein n=1 Tax=Mucilaginibacter sp. TaxID=1882438 RepID=UPI002ED0D5BC
MINLNGKLYKLYYLDTCALSEMVKDRSGFGSNLLNLVFSDGIIAVSPYSLWELKSSMVYTDVIDVITSLHTVLLKPEGIIVKDENQLLNQTIEFINPILIELLAIPNKKLGLDILSLLDKHITDAGNEIFKMNRNETFKIISSKPSNIFSREQLKSKSTFEFSVKLIAYQIAAENLLPELNYYNQIKKEFPVDQFPSLMATSYIHHYKYLQKNRKGEESDVIDILMGALYPYVDVVITEAFQCEIVKQIKRKHNFLNNLEVVSIKQIRLEQYNDILGN